MDRTTQFNEQCLLLSNTTTSNTTTTNKRTWMGGSVSQVTRKDSENNIIHKQLLQLAQKIRSLEVFLKSNSNKYLQFDQHVTFSTTMSDKERNQIDTESQSRASAARSQLKNLVPKMDSFIRNDKNANTQHKDHYVAVVKFLEEYIQEVEGIASRIRRLRRKHEKLSKEDVYYIKPLKQKKNFQLQQQPTQNQKSDLINIDNKQEQMLQQENQQLHNNLFSLEAQLEQIGEQVTTLQDLTTRMREHVELEQEKLSGLFEQASEAQGSMKRGNSNLQLLKAEKKDLRLFLITLLVTLSFALLFLHWVNP